MLGLGLHLRVERGGDDDVLVDRADRVVERVHHVVGGVVDRTRRSCRDQTWAGLASAILAIASVMWPCSAMAVMTCAARSLAPARLWLGASRVGDFISPASSAASDSDDEARALAEIFLRRRLDPVGARAEIDAIEIEFEDLVLGIFALEPERQDRLLDLARERPLLGEEQVLGELLGQGRAALHAPVRRSRRADQRREMPSGSMPKCE